MVVKPKKGIRSYLESVKREKGRRNGKKKEGKVGLGK